MSKRTAGADAGQKLSLNLYVPGKTRKMANKVKVAMRRPSLSNLFEELIIEAAGRLGIKE